MIGNILEENSNAAFCATLPCQLCFRLVVCSQTWPHLFCVDPFALAIVAACIILGWVFGILGSLFYCNFLIILFVTF